MENMTDVRVAVVTGSNRGIGLSIVRGLCRQFKGDVILTARKEEHGKQAIENLNAEGLNPKFHQLDIMDKNSIIRLKGFIQQEYGGLDILVNNAGILGKDSIMASNSRTPPEKIEEVVKTNFTGTLDVCEALFPLLRPHARVVNLSSMGAFVALKDCSETVRRAFTENTLTMENLKQMMEYYVRMMWDGTNAKNGYTNNAYGLTKVAVTSMTCIQQRDIDTNTYPDVLINSCCPGFVRTNLTGNSGCKTSEEGADTPLYLAMLPPNTDSPKGNFVTERRIEPWNSSKWACYKMLARQTGYVSWYYIRGLFK